jgi:hypothetical protein
VGDQVMLSAPNNLMSGVVAQEVLQPTADVLTIRFCNFTATDNLDDTAKTWGYVVTR